MLLPCSLSSLVFGLLVSTSVAYPAPQSQSSQLASYGWPGRLQVLYEALGRRDTDGSRRDAQFLSQIPCDMSRAVLPQAPTPLPPPGEGLSLSHVTIGRGTQNYSCATSTAADQPKLVGAVATLFNVSCVAANYPELLAIMPGVALQFPTPQVDDTPESPSNVLLSGHHFFTGSTPVFDLDTTSHQYGSVGVRKLSGTDAPVDSPTGPNGRGFGSVQWLKLGATSPDMDWKEVYRVETAGGQSPQTCDGLEPAFEVEYAAAYYLYA